MGLELAMEWIQHRANWAPPDEIVVCLVLRSVARLGAVLY
jgi:hypothetical protein